MESNRAGQAVAGFSLLSSPVTSWQSAGSWNHLNVNSVRSMRPTLRSAAARLFCCRYAESFLRISDGVTVLSRIAPMTR